MRKGFTTTDPLGDLAHQVHANPYPYALSDPVNLVDPSGLMAETWAESFGFGEEEGPGTGETFHSSNVEYELLRQNQRNETANAAARFQIARWAETELTYNPYGGREISREGSAHQLSITYEGSTKLRSKESAARLQQIISGTGSAAAMMSAAFGAAGEYHYSAYYNTFLGRNGRHAYTSWEA